VFIFGVGVVNLFCLLNAFTFK
jgi:hypothetical protein